MIYKRCSPTAEEADRLLRTNPDMDFDEAWERAKEIYGEE